MNRNVFQILITHGLTLVLSGLVFSGCAANLAQVPAEIPPMHTVSEFSDDEIISRTADPYESFNKSMYRFNYEADRFVLLPLVHVYETAVPGFVQTGVSNFFANLREIRTFFNCILQAKAKKSLVTLGRFLTNSTVGIGGLFDPATSFGWRQQYEDFDRTLETWGLGTGPYLVLPLLGPNTLRSTGGFVVDAGVRWAIMDVVDPFGTTGTGLETEAGFTGLEVVDYRHSESFRYYESDYPFEYYMVRYIFNEQRALKSIR